MTSRIGVAGLEGPEPVDGLCGPGHPADEISQLDTRCALSRRGAISELLAGPTPMHPTLRAAARALLDGPAWSVLPVLEDPWAQASLFRRMPAMRNVDDPDFSPGPVESLRWLAGTWAEGVLPTASGFAVLPGADSRAYLYLAGSGVLVRTGGPVGAYQESGALRLTLPAQGIVTLTGDTAALPAGRYAQGRVEVLPRVDGRPLLNAVPLFSGVSGVKQAGQDATARGVAVLQQGLELLASAWPAMRTLVDRWVRGFIAIEYEGCSRSHTSIYAPHVLMCTCESPVAVAEALCHETSHGRLFVLAAHHELLIDDYVARHASPWRPDRRPLVSFLNGIHAFVTVCQFYRRLADLDPRYLPVAERAIARQAPRIVQAWDFLQSRATWSPTGERVAATLSPLVEDLRG